MDQIKLFTNDETGSKVRVIVNSDGSLSINAEDVAIGFGWTQIKNGKTYVKFERLNSFCQELGYSPHVGKDDYLPEGLFYLLGFKASNERALKYQKWLALEALPELRKTGAYRIKKDTSIDLPPELQIIGKMFDALVIQNQKIDQLQEANRKTQETVAGIMDVVSAGLDDWRSSTTQLIKRIVATHNLGSFQDVKAKCYRMVETRMHCNLTSRLTRKRKKMELAGATTLQLAEVNKLDVIAENPGLIECYKNVVREIAIDSGAIPRG